MGNCVTTKNSGRKTNTNTPHKPPRLPSFSSLTSQSIRLNQARPSSLVNKFNHTAESHYEILTLLGDGAAGEVRLARNKATNLRRAIKTVQKGNNLVMHEIGIMKELDHPNIIKVYETYET